MNLDHGHSSHVAKLRLVANSIPDDEPIPRRAFLGLGHGWRTDCGVDFPVTVSHTYRFPGGRTEQHPGLREHCAICLCESGGGAA